MPVTQVRKQSLIEQFRVVHFEPFEQGHHRYRDHQRRRHGQEEFAARLEREGNGEDDPGAGGQCQPGEQAIAPERHFLLIFHRFADRRDDEARIGRRFGRPFACLDQFVPHRFALHVRFARPDPHRRRNRRHEQFMRQCSIPLYDYYDKTTASWRVYDL